MIDEKTLQYLNTEPECEVIEADGQQHVVSVPRKTHNVFRALLFPANLMGLAHIGIYTLCLLGLSWVRFVTFGRIHYAGGFIGLIVTLEMLCYFYHCVRESAGGAISAPDSLTMGGADMTGVSATLGGLNLLDVQYLTMIFPFLVCYLPALLYPCLIEDADFGVFLVLLAAGTFYFPMFFLAVVLFDSSAGYNPVLHIVSIFSTFFSYCVLVLQGAGAIALLVLSAIFLSRHYTMAGLLTLPISLYILMVYMHLLGRFFYKKEDKLRWAV